MSSFQIIRAFRKDQDGAAALEFAIVGSALVIAIFGAIELGLLFWTRNALQMTAAMTARCAALNSCANPTAYAQALAGSMVTANILSNATVTVSTSSNCYTTSTAYTGYTKVTISTSFWNNVVVGPLPGTTVAVSACYANPA